MLRDILIGGMLGVALWGWRSYQSTVPPQGNEADQEQPQDPAQKIQALQEQLARTQKGLAVALAKRAEAETQVSELNQLATDRAIELVQLQADSAELLAQVAQLSQKRPRKKRTPKVEPSPETTEATLAEVEPGSNSASPVPLALDLSLILQKQAEATAAAQLLQPIFTDSSALETISSTDSADAEPQESAAAAGLDVAHADFLRVLSQQISWDRQDLIRIAQEKGLLLDGVLEVINEAALDSCDEALTEGDDPIALNPDVLQELMS